MNPDSLKTLGQIAGIAGISVGVLLLVFRDIIRKKIFPKLTKTQAFRVLTLIIVSVWTVALAGIIFPRVSPATAKANWEAVGVSHEESLGILQDVMQREGIATRTDEFHVRVLAPDDYEYSWRDGQREYRLTKETTGRWNVGRNK